jgi:O-antigen/teichoic acid export membrane protein
MTGQARTDRRTLLCNAAANWGGFAVQLAAAFLLAPVLVRGLGEERYGIWSLVESILAYLLLFDLGVAASVVRYVARFETTRDQDNLNRVFSTSLCIFAAAGAAAFAVTLGCAAVADHLWTIPPPLLGEMRSMLLLLGLNLGLGLPLSVFPSVLDGLGRYPAKTVIRAAGVLARSVLFVLVVYHHGGLRGLAWSITLCNLGEHLVHAVAAWRYLPGLRFSFRLADRATFRTIRGYSLDAFLALLAGRVSFQTDALVIGFFLTARHITYFAIAGRLVEYAKNSFRAATTVLTPAVSSLEARGDAAGIRRVLLDGTRGALWFVLPVQAGLLILGRPFLALWMGPEYAPRCFPTLVILTAPLTLALSQSVSARILYGLGRLRWFSKLVLAEAAANLVLSACLAERLGIEGVALGTAIPNVVANLAVAVYVCRLLGVRLRDYVRHAFFWPLVLTAVPAAVWLAALPWLEPYHWFSFLLAGSAGLALYLPLALLVERGPRAVWQRLAPVGMVRRVRTAA